ncbi:MAG: heavy-metal-associated domain-containing protein [Pyrinomonadaceae bacterium]|nr:heavy-metal-associated domain-containing protein [Phycisphaerales bacterium]
MQSKFIISLSLLVLPTLLAACAGSPSQSEEKYISHEVRAADREFAKSKVPLQGDAAVLYVNGMGCPLCASNLDLQLERVKGVNKIEVDLGIGTARITFEGSGRPSPLELYNAVEDAGFTLVKVETSQAGGGQ